MDLAPADSLTLPLPTADATLALGEQLGRALVPGTVIALVGDLGAGKTTLTRGMLAGLGFTGRVKSPTYAILETYRLDLKSDIKLDFYHFDFYRFQDPREWESAGFRECFNPQAVCVIEWPERATGVLPLADLTVTLRHQQDARVATLSSASMKGKALIAAARLATPPTARVSNA